MNVSTKRKKGLNFKQQQAIIEIIKPHKKTYTEIARIIGVNRKTLYNWRKQKEFSKALEKAFNDLRKKVESSAELPIQLQAYGNRKNYEAKAFKKLEITNTLNELKELLDNLLKIQQIHESELETLCKFAEETRKNVTLNKEELEKIKNKIAQS